MRLLADVNISRRVVARLRSAGLDAARADDTIDPRAPDEEVLAEASRQIAVLVTRDLDFSALLAASGAKSPSLINVRLTAVDADIVGAAIVAAVGAAATDLDAGAIVTIDDGGVRVHMLPVG